jgi:periplasmic protein CpxP/Spy
MPGIRMQSSLKFILVSILLLHSLTAIAQSGSDANGSDMGVDPGLPAEAPPASTTAPAAQPKVNRNQPSATLPAPAPESLVTPYDSPSQPAAGTQQPAAGTQQPTPKKAAPISGKLAELNLSQEQTQQIVDLRRQWKPEAEKRLKDEFVQLKQSLAQAMADNSPPEEVRRRFEAMQRRYLDLQTAKFEKLLRIREVLTPEQRRKFAELRSRPTARGGNLDND